MNFIRSRLVPSVHQLNLIRPSTSSAYRRIVDSKQIAYIDEDLRIEIIPYQYVHYRQILYQALCICSLGLVFLITRWIPSIYLRITAVTCSRDEAHFVVVKNHWGQMELVDVHNCAFDGQIRDVFPFVDNSDGNIEVSALLFFEYRYHKFFFNPLSKEYETISNWKDKGWQEISKIIPGLAETTVEKRRLLFGINQATIKEKSTFRLLVDEVLHPFYVFQICSIILWCFDDYYYYASCIFAISTTSAMATLIETKDNIRKLKEMSLFNCKVNVRRGNRWWLINSEELVPGDVFEVSTAFSAIVPCDAIILDGDCIVNESMLTGESIPVSKVSIKEDELKSLAFAEGIPIQSPAMSRYFMFSGIPIYYYLIFLIARHKDHPCPRRKENERRSSGRSCRRR